jgi:hypothetical protein
MKNVDDKTVITCENRDRIKGLDEGNKKSV